MRKAVIRILTFALVLVLAASVVLPAFAADIDLGIVITPGEDGEEYFTVTVTDEADDILAAASPSLVVPCGYDHAYVVHGDTILTTSVLDTENKTITFPVTEGGDYIVQKGTVHIVTFHTNGGSAVAAQAVFPGDPVTKPDDPTKTGYLFDGWYSDAALTTIWDFDENEVAASMTLYAKWKSSAEKLKIGFTELTNAGSWSPKVNETLLQAAASAQGGATDKVELRLTVLDLKKAEVPKADLAAIEALAIGRKLDYLDMSLECSINDGDFVDIGKKNDTLLEITLDYDFSGKDDLIVLRYHDGKAEIIPESNAANQERVKFDEVTHTISLNLNHFSTYAIGYTEGNDTLDDYKFTKGHGSKWAKNSTRNLVFFCEAPYDLLEKITINGEEISLDYAESLDGGIQIKLTPAFLKYLARGKYYLELHFANGGYAIAAFHVVRSSGVANTGDMFNMNLWLALLGISAAAVVVLVIFKKRKQ